MRHIRGLRGELQIRRERFPDGRRARQRQEENERRRDTYAEERPSEWSYLMLAGLFHFMIVPFRDRDCRACFP